VEVVERCREEEDLLVDLEPALLGARSMEKLFLEAAAWEAEVVRQWLRKLEVGEVGEVVSQLLQELEVGEVVSQLLQELEAAAVVSQLLQELKPEEVVAW